MNSVLCLHITIRFFISWSIKQLKTPDIMIEYCFSFFVLVIYKMDIIMIAPWNYSVWEIYLNYNSVWHIEIVFHHCFDFVVVKFQFCKSYIMDWWGKPQRPVFIGVRSRVKRLSNSTPGRFSVLIYEFQPPTRGGKPDHFWLIFCFIMGWKREIETLKQRLFI